MEYSRLLKLSEITKNRSCFLLGPRRTGKSTLLRSQLPGAPLWNLLDMATFRNLSADPGLLRREIRAMSRKPEVVVIDEIQKLPELLNEVHLMIEEDKLNFVLTGSSARSLRKKGVNLLAGRARMKTLHPFVSPELNNDFNLLRAMNHGTIPSIYLSETADEDLADYAGTFLREEIMAEGLTRNLPAFSRFLEFAALCNGTMINFTSLASDAQVKRTTVIDWFDVLKDTLITHELPAWTGTTKRKAIQTAKFYLFDLGVTRHLARGGEILERGKAFGDAFEHFIFLELRAAQSYGIIKSLHYWRSTSQFEVDFLVDEAIAIEVKGKVTIDAGDLKGLRALDEEGVLKRKIVVSLKERAEIRDGIEILPWREFLDRLWAKMLHPRA